MSQSVIEVGTVIWVQCEGALKDNLLYWIHALLHLGRRLLCAFCNRVKPVSKDVVYHEDAWSQLRAYRDLKI